MRHRSRYITYVRLSDIMKNENGERRMDAYYPVKFSKCCISCLLMGPLGRFVTFLFLSVVYLIHIFM